MWGIGIILAVIAYMAATRLKSATTNTAVLAAGALFFSPALFGYGVVRFFKVRKTPQSGSTPFVALLLITYAVVMVALFGTFLHHDRVEAIQETINNILEEQIKTKGVTANFVSAPQLAGVPFIGPNEYDGYFSAKGLAGEKCELATFAFSVRTVSADGSWAVYIPAVSMTQIHACVN